MTNPRPMEIRQTRLKYKLTQRQCADMTRVTLNTWQKWEAGNRKMPVGLWELFIIKTTHLKSY